MYEVEADNIYCYPGTTVLKNNLDLQSQADLAAFEAEITAQRASEPLPEGKLDYSHYRAFHHHLFQDVYPWAGKIRTIRIAKDGNWFCFPENIDAQMNTLFNWLANEQHLTSLNVAAFAAKASHFLAELNAIHPFREGNGRTQLSFLIVVADRAEHPLNMEKRKPEEILKATIASFGANEAQLTDLIFALVKK
jgi:cell filamentation protein